MRSPNRTRFVPRLAALDDRALPSVTITEVGGILSVRGTADAETVAITDNGTSDAGSVSVVADGTTYTSVGAIRRIRVFSGGGDDTVGYTLTGDLPASASRSVTMNLGKGNDVFTADFQAGLAAQSRMDMSVYAGGGNDGLTVFGGLVDVGTGAQFNLDLRGDGGSDTIMADVAGLIQGWIKLEISGGAGTDIIEADATADAGSPGNIYARVKTGAGADMVNLAVNAGGDSFGILYAGADDVYEVTDNVFVLFNQENTTRPPVFPDFMPSTLPGSTGR
jgi:hypothetical protein